MGITKPNYPHIFSPFHVSGSYTFCTDGMNTYGYDAIPRIISTPPSAAYPNTGTDDEEGVLMIMDTPSAMQDNGIITGFTYYADEDRTRISYANPLQRVRSNILSKNYV